MPVRVIRWALGCAGAALLVGALQPAFLVTAVSPAKATTGPAAAVPVQGASVVRRLSEEQYRRSIADIFGSDIRVPGRFEPSMRDHGLLAIGDSKVAISASGFEQYELRAREISSQVLAAGKRDALVPCKPVSGKPFDVACATAFFSKYGSRLYRRKLTSQELADTISIARAGGGDFYNCLQVGLTRLLVSPNFLFRIERSVPDPARPGQMRLDDNSLASRISFLLWDAPPDDELLAAAESGSLRDSRSVERQVDRLIASPRFADGVRAFFSDMLAYDQFDGLTKDQSIYPRYSSQLAKDAREQTLRTIVNLLVTTNGDYRDLFTTRTTFLNRSLAALYNVPLPVGTDEKGWAPYTFGENDPRAGLLTLAAFLMLDPTHEGRSSPTIRGKSVREQLLCEPVPMPPANVNFSLVQNTGDLVHPTARDRLKIHSEDPTCAGCHRITDPVGLSMENFDAIGQWRSHENGALIDASGLFEGKPYKNVVELQRIMRQSPGPSSCIVQRVYEYGVGRQAGDDEGQWLEAAVQSFEANHYSFPALMRAIAISPQFQSIQAARRVAAN